MGGFANIGLKDLQWATEEERRRAEILYAKFKEEWQGTDYKTRATWLLQMIDSAPQWKRVFLMVWFLFGKDRDLEEARIAKEKAEAEAREQKAKAEAEATARCEWEKDAEFIRRIDSKRQQGSYHQKVGWSFFGISLVALYCLAGMGWGWQGIGFLVQCGVMVVPVVLHGFVCSWLAGAFTKWTFQSAEMSQTEVEQRVKNLREAREKLSQRTGRHF